LQTIDSIETLEALYGQPNDASTVKETDRLIPQYVALITASPFVALATAGPEGLDCSPRGDRTGELVRVVDDKTLMLPDRRGNNRVDSLRNIVRDPRVGLLFLIPGSGTTLRLNGRAVLSVDPGLLESFAVDGHLPRSVAIITIDTVFFQCARAVVRSELWNSDLFVDPKTLPTAGEILAAASEGTVGGAAYDAAWSTRAKKSLW